MEEELKLTIAAVAETVDKAKSQAGELIDTLLREAIGDFARPATARGSN